MFRSLIVLASVACTLLCSTASAQGRIGNWFRSPGFQSRDFSARDRRSYSDPSVFGFSIGIGSYPNYDYPRPGEFNPYRFDSYVYDPYRFGSFRAPDLLKDPYFRERYRYDSKFPGRRHRAPLDLRPANALDTYDSYRIAPTYKGVVPAHGQSACHQLSHSIASFQYADAWREYLAPDEVDQLIASGNSDELRELLARYDGIIGDPHYQFIEVARGFAATRNLLRQNVNQSVELTAPLIGETIIH